MIRCDKSFGVTGKFTYVNESLQHYSKLDYFVCCNVKVESFDVLEPDINFSDHLPIFMACALNAACDRNIIRNRTNSEILYVQQLRWDKADLSLYYHETQAFLQPLYHDLIAVENEAYMSTGIELIDRVYNEVVHSLQQCAARAVPRVRKNFFKFWRSKS